MVVPALLSFLTLASLAVRISFSSTASSFSGLTPGAKITEGWEKEGGRGERFGLALSKEVLRVCAFDGNSYLHCNLQSLIIIVKAFTAVSPYHGLTKSTKNLSHPYHSLL